MAAPLLRADQLEMQNGDRYVGKVVSVSADTVVLESEVLGKISVPRTKVSNLAFGTNAAAPKAPSKAAQASARTNLPTAASLSALARTNQNFAAAIRNQGANTNAIRQIREQMLGDSPEAAGKYDEMVNGLMSGKLSIDDIRREAKSSADQLRAFQRDLGGNLGDLLDAYLAVLDEFLKQTASEPTTTTPTAPQPKTQVH
jgi:hypothetical protein